MLKTSPENSRVMEVDDKSVQQAHGLQTMYGVSRASRYRRLLRSVVDTGAHPVAETEKKSLRRRTFLMVSVS